MKSLTCICSSTTWKIIMKKVGEVADVKTLTCIGCGKEVNAFILPHPRMDTGLAWKNLE